MYLSDSKKCGSHGPISLLINFEHPVHERLSENQKKVFTLISLKKSHLYLNIGLPNC